MLWWLRQHLDKFNKTMGQNTVWIIKPIYSMTLILLRPLPLWRTLVSLGWTTLITLMKFDYHCPYFISNCSVASDLSSSVLVVRSQFLSQEFSFGISSWILTNQVQGEIHPSLYFAITTLKRKTREIGQTRSDWVVQPNSKSAAIFAASSTNFLMFVVCGKWGRKVNVTLLQSE